MGHCEGWESGGGGDVAQGFISTEKNAAATPGANTIALLHFDKSYDCPNELRG